MTGYLILIALFLIIAFIVWIRWPVKKTVVYPVDPVTKKLKDGLLSEKPRWKVFKEEHGIAIGFWLFIGLAFLLWCGFGGS